MNLFEIGRGSNFAWKCHILTSLFGSHLTSRQAHVEKSQQKRKRSIVAMKMKVYSLVDMHSMMKAMIGAAPT